MQNQAALFQNLIVIALKQKRSRSKYVELHFKTFLPQCQVKICRSKGFKLQISDSFSDFVPIRVVVLLLSVCPAQGQLS